MPRLADWKRFYKTFTPDEEDKQVDYIDLELCVDDVVIKDAQNNDVPIYFTDVQFQPGHALSGWVPNTQEMLAGLSHTNDEHWQEAHPCVHLGTSPQVRELETRYFNIVGRGLSTITLPNYYPEDWDVEILPTGVDITLRAKEKFDVCRVSTGAGVLLPYGGEERKYDGVLEKYPDDPYIKEIFEEHPLHYRYTREFWVDGANEGTEIKIHASTRIATCGGSSIPIAGERYFSINGFPMYVGRKRFLLAPKGSIRFRIEFYKQIPLDNGKDENGEDYPYNGDLYLSDGGIGFYGTAEFKQWTYGRARI